MSDTKTRKGTDRLDDKLTRALRRAVVFGRKRKGTRRGDRVALAQEVSDRAYT